MDKYFYTIQGERVNLIMHTLEVLKNNPMCDIRIGCDSQNYPKSRESRYVVVVAYKHPNHTGAHFIYNTLEVPLVRDIFTRLFKECEFALEIAEYLTKETGCRIKCIELDYADEKITESTPLVKATTGWITGAGYNASCKSGEQIATRAADHIVTKKSKSKKSRHKKKRK